MSVKNLLKQYAIESGEMEDPDVIDDDLDGEDEEFGYAAEAKLGELVRAMKLTESIESLAARHSSSVFDQTSFEHYQSSVVALLHASDINLPISQVVASMEDVAEGKVSLKDRASAFIQRILAWIREKIKSIKGWFKKRGGDAKVKVEEMQKENTEVKEKIEELKKEGVTAVPVKEPAATPAPAEKPAEEKPAAKKEVSEAPKVGVVEKATKKDGVGNLRGAPAYLLTEEGKLNSVKIRKFFVETIDGIDTGAVGKIHSDRITTSVGEGDPFAAYWKEKISPFTQPSGKKHPCKDGIELHQVQELMELATTAMNEFQKKVEGHGGLMAELEHAEKACAGAGLSDEQAKDLKAQFAKLLELSRQACSFENNVFTMILGIHRDLSRLVAK